MDTKDPGQATQAWKSAIPRVAAAYREGVEGAKDVIQKSRDAEDLYIERVTDAANKRLREKGLANVSDADWKKAAVEKGVSRIAPGMQASENKFARGISNVIGVLRGVSLPERTGDPATNVQNRVTPIAVALREAKERGW